MRFHCLYTSAVSACFELDNTAPYYAPEAFDVRLNGEMVLRNVQTNVFSLFDLAPDAQYTLSIGEDSLVFTTQSETTALSVRDFGAKGDGVTDDTTAIQNAIFACPERGRVVVPAGTYHVRPLTLKSRITLDLNEGATLLADTVEENYPVWPGEIRDARTGEAIQVSTWEGAPMSCRQSFISAQHARDIHIVGRGVIDGNAQNSTWWATYKKNPIARPRLVFLNQCQNVAFHGIHGCNSAAWHFHPFFCKGVYFYDTAVSAPPVSPNTDGSDPDSSDDVRYIGMRFSVGDDAIAIKSGKMYMGAKYKTPASGIVIRNCLMERAHGGVVLGSEMSGGIRDLMVSQCYFRETDRGLRIKALRGRGKYGIIDNMTFSNIRMDNVKAPLVVNMFYCWCGDGRNNELVSDLDPHPVDDTTPYLGKFTFRDMDCTDVEWAAGMFLGLPEQPIESVAVENVRFAYKADAQPGMSAANANGEKQCRMGLFFRNVRSASLCSVEISGQDGERVLLEGVEEFREE